MTAPAPTLPMLCGKIASGKSTLAAFLASEPNTVRVCEDEWLHALFGAETRTLADYVRGAGRLRVVMGPHVAALLNAGLSVVMDFQANTVEARAWMRGILDASGADHKLHIMTTPDPTCLARLRARDAEGDHRFGATEAQFHRVLAHHVAPTAEEGFDIVLHHSGDPT